MNTLREALDQLEKAKEMLSKAIEESLKPTSVLDGKVAIKVNNDREFKLLMEHYESKGWNASNGNSVKNIEKLNIDSGLQNDLWKYGQGFHAVNVNRSSWNIIPFEEFAKEVGITFPVFIMKSEDGVDLYQRDLFHEARLNSGSWVYLGGKNWYMDEQAMAYRDNINSKAFSTKEAAEKWIDEQNKPKHATVKLYRHKEYKSAEVTNDKITIRDGNDIYYLKASDIEDMYHALKSL